MLVVGAQRLSYRLILKLILSLCGVFLHATTQLSSRERYGALGIWMCGAGMVPTCHGNLASRVEQRVRGLPREHLAGAMWPTRVGS